MGYNLSLDSINRWKKELDALVENYKKGTPLVLKTSHPRYLRWQLMQAFKSAEVLEVEPYNRICYILKKKGEYLVAYPKPIPGEIEVSTAETEQKAKPCNGVSGFLALVQTVMKEKETLLSFPDLDPSITPRASEWAEAMGHAVITSNPFTIRRKE